MRIHTGTISCTADMSRPLLPLCVFFFSSHKHHVFFCKLRTHKAVETYCSGSETEFTVVGFNPVTDKEKPIKYFFLKLTEAINGAGANV